MSKLIFTGKQIDAAIKKVQEGFADVSKVTAIASEVREGKKFVGKNKVLQEGTLSDGTVVSKATVPTSPYLSRSETDYPVTFSPSGSVTTAGYREKGVVSGKATKKLYIQAEEKEVTGSDHTYEVHASEGKILKKVTIKKVTGEESGALAYLGIPGLKCYFYSGTASSSTRRGYIPAGTVVDNFSLRAGVQTKDAHVYFFRLGSTTSSSYKGGTGYLISTSTGLINTSHIEIKPGEELTVPANTTYFTPGATIAYKDTGKLTITFNTDYVFFTLSSSGNYEMPIIFTYNGGYYVIVLDSIKWQASTKRYGNHATNIAGTYPSYENLYLDSGSSNKSYEQAETIVSNAASINISCVWGSGSFTTLPTPKIGTGTGAFFMIENARLQKPVVTLEGTRLSWEAVPEATSYKVFVRGDTEYSRTGITSLYTDLSTLITNDGTYTVTVQAVKTGLVSDESDPIDFRLERKLGTPTIHQDGYKFYIDAQIADAQNYYLFVNGIRTNIINYTASGYNLFNYGTDIGTYTIGVKAHKDGRTDSNLSNTITFTRLDTPVLTLTGSVLYWQLIQNATGYELYIDGELIRTLSGTHFDLSSIINVEERHTVSMIAVGNGNTFSPEASIRTGVGGGTGFDDAISVSFGSSGTALTDQFVDSEVPTRYYLIAPRESGYFYLYTESNYDTYGVLYNSDRQQIAYNDDGGSGLNFSIYYYLEAGQTYYLTARQYSSGAAEYTLYVSTTAPSDPTPRPDPPVPDPPEPHPYPYQTTDI